MEKLHLAMERLAKPHFYALRYLLHHLNRLVTIVTVYCVQCNVSMQN